MMMLVMVVKMMMEMKMVMVMMIIIMMVMVMVMMKSIMITMQILITFNTLIFNIPTSLLPAPLQHPLQMLPAALSRFVLILILLSEYS